MSKRYVEIEEEDVMVTEKAAKRPPCGHGRPHHDCKHAVKKLIESVAKEEESIADLLDQVVCEIKDATNIADVFALIDKTANLLDKLCCVNDAFARKIHEACNCPQCDDHDWK